MCRNQSEAASTSQLPLFRDGEENESFRSNGKTDSLVGNLTYYEKAGGRLYVCGVFIANVTVNILLALNRGNEEFQSAKYDGKFAATLINGVCDGPNKTVDKRILRRFILGIYALLIAEIHCLSDFDYLFISDVIRVRVGEDRQRMDRTPVDALLASALAAK